MTWLHIFVSVCLIATFSDAVFSKKNGEETGEDKPTAAPRNKPTAAPRNKPTAAPRKTISKSVDYPEDKNPFGGESSSQPNEETQSKAIASGRNSITNSINYPLRRNPFLDPETQSITSEVSRSPASSSVRRNPFNDPETQSITSELSRYSASSSETSEATESVIPQLSHEKSVVEYNEYAMAVLVAGKQFRNANSHLVWTYFTFRAQQVAYCATLNDMSKTKCLNKGLTHLWKRDIENRITLITKMIKSTNYLRKKKAASLYFSQLFNSVIQYLNVRKRLLILSLIKANLKRRGQTIITRVFSTIHGAGKTLFKKENFFGEPALFLIPNPEEAISIA